MPVLIPLVVLALMLGFNPALRSAAAWQNICRNWAGVAMLAIGLTPVIITGGIDLSVGSVVGLSAVVAGALWRLGLPLEVALACCLLTGLCCGAINGALVLAGINPLVVTLATLGVFRGLAYAISGPNPVDDFPRWLTDAWEGRFLGLPVPAWVVVAVLAAGYLVLPHTWPGRMVFALGDNVRAARFAGVPVRRLTFSVYAASGVIAGLVGLCEVLKSGAAPANLGEGLELTAVACVVLGGVRITGGAGHLGGTLLGTLTLVALLEGVVWVRGPWRPVVTGLFLILVALAGRLSGDRVTR
jgi:ribose/xylose/arabinose/galactoside ABC-type transport system permease subunit